MGGFFDYSQRIGKKAIRHIISELKFVENDSFIKTYPLRLSYCPEVKREVFIKIFFFILWILPYTITIHVYSKSELGLVICLSFCFLLYSWNYIKKWYVQRQRSIFSCIWFVFICSISYNIIIQIFIKFETQIYQLILHRSPLFCYLKSLSFYYMWSVTLQKILFLFLS